MPLPKLKRDAAREETLTEVIASNVEILRTADDEDKVMVAKGISCKFYRDGNNPSCKFCAQEEDTVLACADAYIELMKRVEAAVWSADLEKPVKREVRKVKEVEIGMVCDTCYISGSCPLYAENHTCGIDWSTEEFENPQPTDLVKYLIKVQGERIQKARAMEAVDGGVPDRLLSDEIDRLTGLANTLSALENPGFKFSISASGDPAPAQGILSSIFGDLGKKSLPEETAKPIELPVTEHEEITFEEASKNRLET